MPLPPFIFITAFGAIDTAVRLMKEGAAGYITKPFDLDALMDKIRLQAAITPPGVPPAMQVKLLRAIQERKIDPSLHFSRLRRSFC